MTKLHESSVWMNAFARLIVPLHVWAISAWFLQLDSKFQSYNKLLRWLIRTITLNCIIGGLNAWQRLLSYQGSMVDKAKPVYAEFRQKLYGSQFIDGTWQAVLAEIRWQGFGWVLDPPLSMSCGNDRGDTQKHPSASKYHPDQTHTERGGSKTHPEPPSAASCQHCLLTLSHASYRFMWH